MRKYNNHLKCGFYQSINGRAKVNMKKPKTVEGWLKTLPEPLRRGYLIYTRQKCNSLSEAIMCISWHYSKEGYHFWKSFYDALIWAESKEG